MTLTDTLLTIAGLAIFLVIAIVVAIFLVERHDPSFYVAPEDEDDELRYD